MAEQQIPGVQQFDQQPMLVNQYTINHGPEKFVIDLRNMLPQFGPNGEPTFVLAHKMVLFDPYVLKGFAASMLENIKKYEERYGTIKKPDAVLKAEKEVKKNQVKMEATTSEKISYVG